MKIIYRNEHETIIEEKNISADEYYTDPECLKGKYKSKEIYENDKLTNFTVFFDFNIKHAEILKNKNYQGIDVSIGIRTYFGIIRHEKIYHYNSKGVLETIFNRVFNSENNVIVSSFTDDTINETPYWNGTSKYYYDHAIRPDHSLFECHYDDDGNLIPITIDVEDLGLGDHDGTWIYDDEDGINELIKIFNMPRALAEFYLSSNIIPKETLSNSV